MKPFGCIVPVSFIVVLALLLSGCAARFGTYTDGRDLQPFVSSPKVHYKAPIKHAVKSTLEKPYVCTPRQAEAGECLPLVDGTSAVAEPTKVKKKGFWSRVRSHLTFKKKDQ